jgi:hypothetical protein
MKRKKTIAFIDNWSIGANFCDPLVKLLKIKYNVVFVHFDSYYNDQNLKTSVDMGLYDQVIDIGLHNNSIYTTLAFIKPEVLVYVSIHNHFHRWTNVVASQLNIPSIFFMHGVRADIPRIINRKTFIDKIKKINRVLFFLKQYFYYINDIKSFYIKENSLSLFLDLYDLIFQNRIYTVKPNRDIGFKYDCVAVNTNADISFFKKNYFMQDKKTQFIVSGNILSRSDAIKSLAIENSNNMVIFLSQPNFSAGDLAANEDLNAIISVNNSMARLGYDFIVRLHPRDDIRKETLLKLGIRVSERLFYEDIARAWVAISYNSAALYAFNDVGKPMVVITDDRLPFLSGLKSELVSNISLCKINEIEKNIKKSDTNLSKNKKDIFPAEEIIFNSIEKIISDKYE